MAVLGNAWVLPHPEGVIQRLTLAVTLTLTPMPSRNPNPNPDA